MGHNDAADFFDYLPHLLNADAGTAPWVILGLYVAFLLGIGVWGLWRSCTQDMKSEGGKVNDHYVAGNNMGTYILPLTYFATMFSGYTVVGIPGEVWRTGYFGFRWLGPLLQWYSLYNVVVASRLAFLAKKRASKLQPMGYQSPTDFISDRYRSKTLTVITSLTLVFPTIFYVLAQFKSMGGTISGLSDGDITAFEAASVFCAIMLIYENLGGLRGVALTDAVQGSVMIFCFLFFHITAKELFGGIPEAGDFLENYDAVKAEKDAEIAYCTTEDVGLNMICEPNLVDGVVVSESVDCEAKQDATCGEETALVDIPACQWTTSCALKEPYDDSECTALLAQDQCEAATPSAGSCAWTTECTFVEPAEPDCASPQDEEACNAVTKESGPHPVCNLNTVCPKSQTDDLVLLPEKAYSTMLSDADVHSWINFGALMMSYSFYPQMISRCNAAKDQNTMKRALLFTHMGGWISMVSGALTGVIAIKWFGPPGTIFPYDPMAPEDNVILPSTKSNDIYGQVMRVAIAEGGGHAFLGTLMITASAAAFMSTADSGLIAASSLLTLDVWRPYLVYPWWDSFPAFFKSIFFNDKENCVLIIGKATSIILGVLILVMTDMDIELGPLFSLQGALLCQVLPTYIFGMLISWIKPFACCVGTVVGVFVLVGIQCDNGTSGCTQPTGWTGPYKEVAPGLLAMFINMAICIILSLEIWIGDSQVTIRPALLSMPAWDKITDPKFKGDKFPAELCGLDIRNAGGPKLRPWYMPQGLIMVAIIFMMSFTTPWWRYQDWGKEEEFIAHVPKYIFDLLIVGMIGTILGWATILYFWSDDDEVSNDKDLSETMELAAAEKGTDTTAEKKAGEAL